MGLLYIYISDVFARTMIKQKTSNQRAVYLMLNLNNNPYAKICAPAHKTTARISK